MIKIDLNQWMSVELTWAHKSQCKRKSERQSADKY